MQNKMLSACLFALLFVLPCFAQKGIHQWTGFYVGANTGAAFGKIHIDSYIQQINNATNVKSSSGPLVVVPGTTRSVPESSENKTGFTGGIQIGYGKQLKQWSVGLEADFDALSFTGTQSVNDLLPSTLITSVSNYSIQHQASAKWMETTRVRIGYFLSHTLLYGTVGIGFANIKATANDNFAAQCCGAPNSNAPAPTGTIYAPQNRMESVSKTGSNVSFGGGYEWSVSGNVTVGAEYRYLKVTNSYNWSSAYGVEGSVTPNQSGGLAGGFGIAGQDVEMTTNSVTAKVNVNLQAFKKKKERSNAKRIACSLFKEE